MIQLRYSDGFKATYALISDIHGNLVALKAVLDDAALWGVDGYFFLGDYIQDFPWPNDVVETIRSLPNVTMIRGNKEDYMLGIRLEDQSKWNYEQYAPIYWNFKELSLENLNFLETLPTAKLHKTEHFEIKLEHSSEFFISGQPRFELLHSIDFLKRMKTRPAREIELFFETRRKILCDPGSVRKLSEYPPGINAFGHNHLPWMLVFNDAVHVNPGSCGVSLNMDPRAHYSLIRVGAKGVFPVARRIKYDIEKACVQLKKSGLYKEAPHWSNLVIREIQTGEDVVGVFLRFLKQTASELGCSSWPVDNQIWSLAAEKFVYPY
ncbi:MAG: metallophosphoesterase [Clostridiales bacterium]|jgi:predicted phosphodiesterase|nr:metallophosphoesterase [Clostridiales bacterium]